MNIRKYSFLIFCFVTINISYSQKNVKPGKVNWYTFEQADSLFKINPKPLLIDVYTEWCSWCKHMMKTTFAHKDLASYINKNFYPVRFDAETLDTIYFNNEKYINNGIGKKPKHELASKLLNGRFSFPTIVFIDKQRKQYPIPGYMSVRDIEPLLVYFSEEINSSIPYDEWKIYYYFSYQSNYLDEIKEIDGELYPDTSGDVKWNSIKDASEKSIKDSKPIFILLYTDWCYSCNVLKSFVLKDSIISALLNDHFHPVLFNAASTNIEYFFTNEFKPSGPGKPHSLTYAFLKQSFQFPAYVIISSKKQKLTELHGFMSAHQIEIILNYFLNENYKKQSFEDFIKTFEAKLKRN